MAFNYGYGQEIKLPLPRKVYLMRDGSVKDPEVSRSHKVLERDLIREVEVYEGDNFFDTEKGEFEIYVNHRGEVYDNFRPYRKISKTPKMSGGVRKSELEKLQEKFGKPR